MSGAHGQRSREGDGILHLYQELWRHSAGRRSWLCAAMLLLAAAQCVLLAVPYVAGRAINALQSHGAAGVGEAARWLALVIGITAGSWLLHGPARILERNVALEVRRRVAAGLTAKLMSLPLQWHETHQSGVTAHRVQQASHALCAFAQSQFIYLNSAVRLVGPVLALWWLEPWVGIAAVAGFCIICLSVIGFDRGMIRLAHAENAAERRYAASLIESLGNSVTLFALRQARAVSSMLQLRLEAVAVPLRRSILLNEAKWCVVDIAARASSCLLVALFAWLTLRGARGGGPQLLLLGSLYMVWEYAGQAGGVISSVAAHFQTFARQHADYRSGDAIADERAEPLSPARGAADWRRCKVRDLVFYHPGSRSGAPTLDAIELSLERGKRYALIGASGSGKSTLLKVLAGLYQPQRIIVERDATSTAAAGADAAALLRATTTLIPQDAEVFEATLGENLGLCEALTTAPQDAEYLQALRIACVDDFIAITPAALQVPIAERAANWSGGQRARVALARGVLAAAGSSLVLLDEPTASLDLNSELRVFERLAVHFQSACMIASVHRLHLLERFDEIIVMHAGRVVAQGSAHVLAATSAEFRQLLSSYQQHATRVGDYERAAPRMRSLSRH